MKSYRLLVLTDHRNHTSENALYPMVCAFRKHPYCLSVDVVSRGNEDNKSFFYDHQVSPLRGCRIDDTFDYHPDGRSFYLNIDQIFLNEYDAVWLRLPPPLSPKFLSFLEAEYPDQLIINKPSGISKTGSKEFLLNFPECCAPMKICRSVKDISTMLDEYPIVLKPFKEYGGRGLVKIANDKVWINEKIIPYNEFVKGLSGKKIEYLGVQYLENVGLGDKRIVVIDGQIMGASLRLPAKGSWICNVAMGGSSTPAHVTAEEVEIIKTINPTLSKMGIMMYGIDTLVGNDGRRLLSEINTTSIGGLPQIAKLSGQPLLESASELFWKYIHKKKNILTSEIN